MMKRNSDISEMSTGALPFSHTLRHILKLT